MAPVSMEDDFASDQPLPLFLSDHADEHADEHEERGSLLLLNASILLLVVSLGGIAIVLSQENPVKVLAAVTASLTNFSPVRAVQSTANVQALPPTAKDPSGVLLKQFQAWAAKQDASAQVEPVQSVLDARAEMPVQNPWPKVRREQNAQAQVPPVPDARAQDQSGQNPQAPSFLERWGHD